jgi:pyridinium-3,5-biscarboxylic acid mononucleotide sulfurtransferase
MRDINKICTDESMQKLQGVLARYSSAVVAYSGGVDSTFLAKVCADRYGDKCLLVTATSSTYPFFELEEAKKYAELIGCAHRVIVSEEIEIPGFSDNPPDRCYYCKSELFLKINRIAQQEGYDVVFDGSNADDTRDYRPGRRAIAELGIVSPLCDGGLTKEDIRRLSRQLELPTADKPSFACLASRFPYGEKITKEKLDRVGKAEIKMREMGFGQFRVRSHENLARIECAPPEMDRAWQMRELIVALCKEAGYTWVALDLMGYRTGAMNEVL